MNGIEFCGNGSRLVRQAGLLFALFAAWLLVGSPALAASETQISEIYRTSGLDRLTVSLPESVKAGFAQQQGQNAQFEKQLEGLARDVDGLIDDTFVASEMDSTIQSRMARDLTEPQAKEVIDWLRSPIGKRLTAKELRSAEPDFLQELVAYGQGLQANPPDAGRIALLQDFDVATQGTERTVDIALNTHLALLLAASASMPATERPSLEQLMAELEKVRPQLTQTMNLQVAVTNLFIYRDVSDTDMKRYLEFLRSDAGRAYNAAVANGMKEAFIESARRFGEGLAELSARQAAEKDA